MPSNAARERVLFLYLPTGGGHISNARAISAALAEHYNAEILIHDPVSDCSRFAHWVLKEGYRIASIRAPLVWSMVFKANTDRASIRRSQRLFTRIGRSSLARVLAEWQPTRLVCLHHLLLDMVSVELQNHPHLPAVVVATDPFGPPPLWAESHQLPIFCYSEMAWQRFVDMGVPAQRLQQFHQIIDNKFMTRLAPAAIAAFKSSLGLQPQRRLVLLAGGGDGMRQADDITRELCRSGQDFDIAVVCGNDAGMTRRMQTVAARLMARRSASPSAGTRERRIVVFGFTRQMYELINSADAVVTKAGPAVLAEVLAAGKPNFISFFIPGQEEPNVQWVERHGVGVYCPAPALVRQNIERYFTDQAWHDSLQSAIAATDFRNGLSDIAAAIMALGPPTAE